MIGRQRQSDSEDQTCNAGKGKAVSASRRTFALAEEILRLRAMLVELQGKLTDQSLDSHQMQLQLVDAKQQVASLLSPAQVC